MEKLRREVLADVRVFYDPITDVAIRPRRVSVWAAHFVSRWRAWMDAREDFVRECNPSYVELLTIMTRRWEAWENIASTHRMYAWVRQARDERALAGVNALP